MRTLLITQDGVEKARVSLQKRSFLLGRSPSCDVVLRGKNIKAIQFLLEWIGEGEFDPKRGIWTLVDIAAGSGPKGNVSQGSIGDVITEEDTKIFGFNFCLIEDRLAETPLKKGVLSRQIETDRRSFTGLTLAKINAREVLEVISYRNDLGYITDVQHYSEVGENKSSSVNLADQKIHFVWNKENGSIGFLEDKGSEINYTLHSQGIEHSSRLKKNGQKLQARSTDLFRLNIANNDYILRFVSPLNVSMQKQPIYKDAYLQVISFIFLCFIAMISWIQISPLEEKPVDVKPPRVATVEIKEVKEPAPPRAEPTPAPVTKEVAKKVEPVKQLAPKKAVKEKPTMASAAVVKNSKPTEPVKSGLNNPAPVKNVNKIGLLGKLKSGGTSNSKVSVDMALNQGIVSKTVTGNTGFVVKKPPMGELGVGKKDGGGDVGPGLAAASTTMKNPAEANARSAGPIGLSGAGSLNSVGTALKGKEGSNIGGDQLGDVLGTGGFDVEGGLSKDDIRRALAEHRRAIRNCYEIALLTKKDLAGRLVLKWRIRAEGSVEFTELISSDMKAPSFQNCVQNVVKGIVFPIAQNQKMTVVRYPFIFQGKK